MELHVSRISDEKTLGQIGVLSEEMQNQWVPGVCGAVYSGIRLWQDRLGTERQITLFWDQIAYLSGKLGMGSIWDGTQPNCRKKTAGGMMEQKLYTVTADFRKYVLCGAVCCGSFCLSAGRNEWEEKRDMQDWPREGLPEGCPDH